MTVRIRDEGICELCNTECSREPGSTCYNFFGWDQCKLDPDEGPHIVRVWHSAEVEQDPPIPQIEVVLYGRDPSGNVVELREQRLMSTPGAGWSEHFQDPAEVTAWSIKVKL